MRPKSGSKDCRFSYILVDVDFCTNQCVDCRPDGLNSLMFITGKSAVQLGSINHQILASHFITLHVIQICFI